MEPTGRPSKTVDSILRGEDPGKRAGEVSAGVRVNVRDFENAARQKVDPIHADYFNGGAGDEITLRANEKGFENLKLLPRVLRGSAKRELDVTLLGSRAAMPVLLSPTAFHRLARASEAEVEAFGRNIWATINEVNLVENIQPTRARASLVLHKGADHSVSRVRLRRF